MRNYSVYDATDQTPVTSAETVIGTLSGISTDRPGQTIDFHGSATITSAATQTGATLRVREDSLTGSLVGEAKPDTLYGAIGDVETHTIDVSHSNPGEFSGKTYVLTIENIAATANPTVNSAGLNATVRP